jgi:Holliday junction DNA helicase RuvA
MYAYLEGKFSYKSAAQVYLDVNGVGYEVNITLNTFSEIQQLDHGKLFTHLQVKEDGHILYGFFHRAEKEMFLLLISVSGVGAATARMMLSSMKSEEVRTAIMQGNVRLMESVKGIGRKTAERLILELKDKVGKTVGGIEASHAGAGSVEQDAMTALTALGISRIQAEHAVKKIVLSDPSVSQLEDLIKKALKAI